eukprot:m.464464 g.464464  ORF g.464464 m.464464 type:complete len:86 (+) comp57046_c0_seq20:371-628(+)
MKQRTSRIVKVCFNVISKAVELNFHHHGSLLLLECDAESRPHRKTWYFDVSHIIQLGVVDYQLTEVSTDAGRSLLASSTAILKAR